MRKIPTILLISFLLYGCNKKEEPKEETPISYDDYGAFLGRDENKYDGFINYKYVAVELDEYLDTTITRLTKRGTNFLAYLNVGSLENYRDYYDDYESFTFKDYDNWPDERWIDVRNASWQDKMVELAAEFKDRGAYGLYLDNVDVYSIAKEENMDYSAFADSLKSIISRISELDIKVLVNGGAEYFDDMNDQADNVFDSIWAYHQEEVFSLIDDYEKNTFVTQEEEDKAYYQEIASMMKSKGKEVFFLEYTTDNTLKETIKTFCKEKQYHYYIADDVELK